MGNRRILIGTEIMDVVFTLINETVIVRRDERVNGAITQYCHGTYPHAEHMDHGDN